MIGAESSVDAPCPIIVVVNISINDAISIGMCFLVERRGFLSIQNQMPKRIEVMIIRINQVVPNVVSITFIGDVSSLMV